MVLDIDTIILMDKVLRRMKIKVFKPPYGIKLR